MKTNEIWFGKHNFSFSYQKSGTESTLGANVPFWSFKTERIPPLNMAYLAVEKYGLRPLAVHLDNTFNNAIATENIHKVLGALNIDLVTHVVARNK